MSNVKILVALLAACILVMPAFSMPDNGNPTVGQDGNAANCPKPMMDNKAPALPPCPCMNPIAGQDGNAADVPTMDNKAPAQQPCPCMNPIAGQDGKAPAGQDGNAADSPKPMMDNKAPAQQPFPCMNPIAGQDGKAPAGQDGKAFDGPKSMMGNDDTKIVCLITCKVIGQDGQQIPPMMGDGTQEPSGMPAVDSSST